MELLAACGTDRRKRIFGGDSGLSKDWKELVTLDIDPGLNPDVVHNLDDLPYPFEDETFDEIHLYEGLEHCGTQGDEFFFFEQFNEFHRILKPGGVFCGSVPHWKSIWAFGDPGHKRVLPPSVFNFLTESFYDQVGKTACADYRSLIKGYWKTVGIDEGEQVFFLLQKV